MLGGEGAVMTTLDAAAMARYAYDQIDQTRAGLKNPS
jgi:hypothetical protein